MPKRVVGANQGPQTKKGSWCQSRPQKGELVIKKSPKKVVGAKKKVSKRGVGAKEKRR